MNVTDIISDDAVAIARSSLVPWHKMEGKTVLITGANGYVPSYFVHALMKRNELFDAQINVVALCRNEERALKKFKSYTHNRNFKLLIQDVVDPIECHSKIHYFIHAASPAGYYTRHENPANTFTANVIGCKNLLDLSRAESTESFLLLSSVDVYGRNLGSDRISEKDFGYLDPLDPRNSYASGKLAAEGLCKSYHSQFGTPCRIVRPFQILGNGFDLSDGRLHADFMSQLLSKNCICLKGDGLPKRTFMYVNDAIVAMFLVMLRGTEGEAYNICDEDGELTVLELAKKMVQLKKGPDAEVKFDYTQRDRIEVKTVIPNVLGDASKLRSLGFRSEYSLQDSISRMMNAYGILTSS